MSVDTTRAPLAFSQLAHWQAYQLGERPAIRQIALAMRWCGPLNLSILEASWGDVITRHDALRTRIVVGDGEPLQEISSWVNVPLSVADMTYVATQDKNEQIKRMIYRSIMTAVDPASGPLWSVDILRFTETEHVMIVAMEHIISDAFSLGILRRHLLSAYSQRSSGRQVLLPKVSLQFWKVATQQRDSLASLLATNGEYWTQRLSGCERVRLSDRGASPPSAIGWGAVSFRVAGDLKKSLREWSRRNRTTLPMCVFTAYVALVMRWCKKDEIVVLYQSDGRDTPEVENTIGYLAFPLYLRVELRPSDRFVDLMRHLIDEYCTAYLHADRSYLETRRPRPSFTRNTCFNWISRDSAGGFPDVLTADGSLRIEEIPFEHPMLAALERDTEPSVLLYDMDEGILGDLLFSLASLSEETMRRFSRNLIAFLTALSKLSDAPIGDIGLVA
jgi:hypothetical protein